MKAVQVCARVAAITAVLAVMLVVLALIGSVTAVGLLYLVAVAMAPPPQTPDLNGPLLVLLLGSAACSAVPHLLRRRR